MEINDVEVISRLETFKDEMAMSSNAFAQKAGVDPSGFTKMLKGQISVTGKNLKKIADAYNLRMEWLLTGEGDKYLPKAETVKEETRPRLPITVEAGKLSAYSESVLAHQCEQIPVIKVFPSYDFTMVVKGNSMEPKYEGGDEIAIRKVVDYIEWGKVYVLDTSEGVVLKRVYDAGDKYRCVSYNNEYPDFEVSKSDVYGIYRVVGLIRV